MLSGQNFALGSHSNFRASFVYTQLSFFYRKTDMSRSLNEQPPVVNKSIEALAST